MARGGFAILREPLPAVKEPSMTEPLFSPMAPVVITPCADYGDTTVEAALDRVLTAAGGLSWVTPGMTVGIKANLVSAMRPEECATTHPALLCALCRRLADLGAKVIIGDSPGGLYTAAFVGHVYEAAGMTACEAAGATLNHNFDQREVAFPEARVLKHFTYTAWLDECDAIINFCKLKSHGMMGMSAAAKNLFGIIPGTMKPEYHFRFPNTGDFSHMLVDINDFLAPKLKLCLVDAVEAMEGNGPTKGTPRHMGLLLASTSPHTVDLLAARLIHLTAEAVPTLLAARERGYIPDTVADLNLLFVRETTVGESAPTTPTDDDLNALSVADFQNVAVRHSLLFASKGKLVSKVLGGLLSSRPALKASDCIGCGKCANICPAHAITMVDRKATIDRNACIRCFCCQEFCPTGAMKVHRTFIARMLVRGKN